MLQFTLFVWFDVCLGGRITRQLQVVALVVEHPHQQGVGRIEIACKQIACGRPLLQMEQMPTMQRFPQMDSNTKYLVFATSGRTKMLME